MKRSECTVEKLMGLGYKALYKFDSWHNHIVHECNPEQAQRVFEVLVEAVRNGDRIDIEPSDFNHTVNVYVENFNFRGTRTLYYITRPMTEAEAIEADIRTGRGKDWDYIVKGENE